MYEILKTLAEEPEKLNKILIKLVRVLLILMLSNSLYTWVLDRSLVSDISNPNEWLQLTGQGYLIVFVFLLFTSFIILFVLLPIVSVWISPFTKWIIRRIVKKSASDVDKGVIHGLVIANVIERRFHGKRMKAGRNFDDFYVFLKTVTAKNKPQNNYSLGSETLEIFIAFIFIYYLLIDINVRTHFIDVSLILLIVIFSIVYAISSLFIEFLVKQKNVIKYMLDWLKTEKMIFDLLEQNGIKVKEVTEKLPIRFEEYFIIDTKTYYINYKSHKFRRHSENDENLINFLNENSNSYVITLYLDRKNDAIIPKVNIHDRLINFTFQSRKELKQKFKEYFINLL